MAMPLDLVLVRHGQSEQNLASKFSKLGDTSLYTDEFKSRPVSQHRLTDRGRQQAKEAGEWLKSHGLEVFERKYVSDYVRAKETAGLLDLEGADWYVDHMLREREWGDYDNLSWEERSEMVKHKVDLKETDPFYWTPPNGESIAQLTVRLRHLFDTLHRECADKRVIVVCHGEVMNAFQQMIERLPVGKWVKLHQSKDKKDRIHNCQIFHYSRRDPESGEIATHLNWTRSICPWDESRSSNDWRFIKRERFNNRQLLGYADRVKPLFKDIEQSEDW